WRMSMAWMRMPGQTWANATASFIGMWAVMMSAMMLPAVVPVLWRYREELGGTDEAHKGRLTALVAFGYFLVWMVPGTVVFSGGVALTTIEMKEPAAARFVPLAAGLVVLISGATQFTAWKAHHLACCRELPRRRSISPLDARSAWRYGMRVAIHCLCCSAGRTAVLIGLGVMDLWTMAAVTAGIALERFAPNGDRVARAIGVVVIAAGLALIARSFSQERVATLHATAIRTATAITHAPASGFTVISNTSPSRRVVRRRSDGAQRAFLS